MIGTISHSNWLDRIGAVFASIDRAFKTSVPSPAQLYPPRQDVSTGFLTFPGWDTLERQSGNQDEQRIRTALQSTSVFSNMQAVANEVSSAELLIKERVNDAFEDVENHPLEVLWDAPNPHMGRSFLMSFWAWSYTLAGKAFLYWLPVRGEIHELWPIPPFMIKPVPATKEFIGGYAFRSGPTSDPIVIPPEYITYSHSVNLFDMRDGLSFLAAAMVAINSEIAEMLWNQNFFGEDNAVPAGLITVPRDTLDSDLARVRQEIRDFFGGTRRGVAVARAGDMDYKAFIRSQKDVEFEAGIRLASEQIDRAMGFPRGYWSERANRANAQQARETMIAGAVWPLLVRLHEDMNAQQIKRWYGEQYRAEFKDIRPEDRELKLREQENRKTHWTINELREADGKEPLEDPRGRMLLKELEKGTPLPATPASIETEDFLAAQEAALVPAGEPSPIEGESEITALPEEGVEAGVPIEGDVPMKSINNYRTIDREMGEATELRYVEEVPAKTYPRVFATIESGKIVGVESPDDPSIDGLGSIPQSVMGMMRHPNTSTPKQEEAMRDIGVGSDAFDELIASPQSQAWLEQRAMGVDLARWERKALKSLRRFKTAAVKFESVVIPEDEQARIRTVLEAAASVVDVRAAFYIPKTKLGNKLWAIRKEGVTNDQQPLTEDEIKAGAGDVIDSEWDAAVEWAGQVME